MISSEQTKLTLQFSINPQLLHPELSRATICLSGCQVPYPEVPSTGKPYDYSIPVLEKADKQLMGCLLTSAYCYQFADAEVVVFAVFFLPFLPSCQGGGSELACGWRTKTEISLSQSMIVWAQRQLYHHSSHCFAIFYHLAATQSLLLEQMLLGRK